MARETMLVGVWRKLADAVGGVGKLAEACGVNRDTIRRWASGEFEPKPVVKMAVGTLAREHGVDLPPFGEAAKRAAERGAG